MALGHFLLRELGARRGRAEGTTVSPMTALTLHRIDPTRNMQPFCRLDAQPDLFGGLVLHPRVGTHRQSRTGARSPLAYPNRGAGRAGQAAP